MSRTTLVALAITLAVSATAAYADDNSMSRWTGDSYRMFEAARTAPNPATAVAGGRHGDSDNSMSRWNGESYLAFEQQRTVRAPTTVTETRAARLVASRNMPGHPTRGPTPFRDDTGA